MKGYLGEENLDSLVGTPFEGYTPNDWALEYVGRYGGIDGDHHKMWVLDQVARILKGTPILLKIARWSNGESEYRFTTGEPSQAYLDWVKEMCGDYDPEEQCYEYHWDEGVPP